MTEGLDFHELSFDDLGDEVCLHKGGQTYTTRVGECCPFCGRIRHRHSTLAYRKVAEFGGITALETVVVPLRGATRRIGPPD